MCSTNRKTVALAALVWMAGCRDDAGPSIPTECVAPSRPSYSAQIDLVRVFEGVAFEEGVALLQQPEDDRRWYLVTKHGVVHTFENDDDVDATSTFIDVSSAITEGGEAGLLGMTFHPDFAQNGQVFLSYNTPGDGAFLTRVSRFTSPDGGLTLDPGSEQVVFELTQPYVNHNGGDVHFGHDGYLYISLGDGGSGEDPHGHGQNTDTLLGSMVRIDVDGADPYAIPEDNPFAAGGGQPEIFAWGIRNIWRFSFDRETGDLWAGDVGQYDWEEVDKIELGRNYGWSIREGANCFMAPSCDLDNLVDPIAEYENPDDASVVGGYVYRGTALPALVGTYLYADFYLGTIWGVIEGDEPELLYEDPGLRAAAFAEGNDGELYVVHYNGRIHRVEPSDGAVQDELPTVLSQTGCVDPKDPSRPSADMVPYTINVPFWSDGATKERFVAVPEGEQIVVGADGDWDLPPGSVLLKHFRLDDVLVETRLFMRHPDGVWAGYSYAWNEDGTDADLLSGQSFRELGSQQWSFPGRSQCMECHTEAAGFSLGLETAQLVDVEGDDPIGRLVNRGILAEAPSGTPYAAPAGDAPLDERARTYLHVNCATCHRDGTTAETELDFHYDTPAAMMAACDVTPTHGDLGIADARLIAPGDPARSMVSARMHTTGRDRMPGIGSNVVDDAGAAVIDAWISGMTACPP